MSTHLVLQVLRRWCRCGEVPPPGARRWRALPCGSARSRTARCGRMGWWWSDPAPLCQLHCGQLQREINIEKSAFVNERFYSMSSWLRQNAGLFLNQKANKNWFQNSGSSELTVEANGFSNHTTLNAFHSDLVRIVDLHVEGTAHDSLASIQDLHSVATCKTQASVVFNREAVVMPLNFNKDEKLKNMSKKQKLLPVYLEEYSTL